MAFAFVHHIRGSGRVELECSGDIDARSVAAFRRELGRLQAGSARHVTVDLRRVDRLDAAGVAAVAAAAMALRHRGGELRVIEPHDPVAGRILDYSGLLPLLAA